MAWATKSDTLELYESGIGAINAPLLAGMEGSQATRSCHPVFLEKMSRLLSLAAENPITIVLPFKDFTKGELVRGLAGEELQNVARNTISCANIHCSGIGQSCGFCPACIFRRLALHTACIEEPGSSYQVDLMSPTSGQVASEKLNYLKAFLLLVDHLEELDAGQLPIAISRHLRQTGILKTGKPMQFYLELFRRYRAEWLSLVRRARANGCPWGGLIALHNGAA